MTQLGLFDSGLEARFRAFDSENPEVWRLFVRFTLELIEAGRKRYSADALLHRIRWHYALRTTGDDDFKVNNNWAAFYARKWIALHPEHADFFETRRRTAA